jgi:putative oxidoreductase
MKNIKTFVSLIHQRYSHYLGYLKHPFILLIRLYWGYDFFQTGMGKLQHLDRTTEFFTSLNIPFPHLNALVVGNIEMIGGVLLMAGLGARYFTLPLFAILSVAYLTDDHDALVSIFSNPEQFVSATPFQHLWATLTVLIFGAGGLSLDGLLYWWRKKSINFH